MYNVNHVSLLVYFLMHFIIILKPYFSFENSKKNILCILKCTQGYVIYVARTTYIVFSCNQYQPFLKQKLILSSSSIKT